MSSLSKRVISAIIVGGMVLGIYLFFGVAGLVNCGYAAGLFAIHEYNSMTFRRLLAPVQVQVWFAFFSAVLLLASVMDSPWLLGFWGAAVVCFISGSLWMLHNRMKTDLILLCIGLGVTGLLYCGLLPALLIRILLFEDGPTKLLTFLMIVFFGDTFAYFGGRLLGVRKLMPELSPHKTVAGAFSGLGGSLLAGFLAQRFLLSGVSLSFVLPTAIITGYLAQNGDLFESLLKRVAHVKDSGHIMPGHGGVLDRLDGVFFACPIFYTFCQVYLN